MARKAKKSPAKKRAGAKKTAKSKAARKPARKAAKPARRKTAARKPARKGILRRAVEAVKQAAAPMMPGSGSSTEEPKNE